MPRKLNYFRKLKGFWAVKNVPQLLLFYAELFMLHRFRCSFYLYNFDSFQFDGKTN